MDQGSISRHTFTHRAGDKLFIDYTGKEKLTIVDRDTGELQT
jgi:hypothetical protein